MSRKQWYWYVGFIVFLMVLWIGWKIFFSDYNNSYLSGKHAYEYDRN